jgi:dihydrofolate reductase
MKTILIAAISENNAIGKNNDLIWRLPNDMKFFKEKTTGHCIVTGRKNYESIPEKFRPLPNRTNIVVTRQLGYEAKGANVALSVQNALTAAESLFETECYIIGGGEIYAQTIDQADEMYITKVHHTFEDADTFFPAIDESKWQCEIVQPKYDADEKHAYSFTILHYTRK